ncbi:hypothetical protein IVB56_27215 [Bradyrhizobium sp. CW7]|uniref:hypothetical protein n=1 Tax=Bradyrhizobium sp. CW7 TaxID=2782688 RepID=UPI001FFAD5FA|nr:hypothetical protein [Bradyrhizobium sp. CW7]MCK1354639.1 hypothetical protein [Bradyrhizobium sp. CW7]
MVLDEAGMSTARSSSSVTGLAPKYNMRDIAGSWYVGLPAQSYHGKEAAEVGAEAVRDFNEARAAEKANRLAGWMSLTVAVSAACSHCAIKLASRKREVEMAELCDRPDQTNPIYCSNQTAWTISFAQARFYCSIVELPPEFATDTGEVRVVTTDLAPGLESAKLDMCRLVGKPIRASRVVFQGKSWIIWNGRRLEQDLPPADYSVPDPTKQYYKGPYRIGWKTKPAAATIDEDKSDEPPALEPFIEELKI